MPLRGRGGSGRVSRRSPWASRYLCRYSSVELDFFFLPPAPSLGNIPGAPRVFISGNGTWFPSSRFFSPGPRDQEMVAFTVKLDLSVPV
ncbi:hypothetical protein NDU88_005019 [Pleurodeles waltl]|uniref:Uncharacterized protein n=1 Tax=Pleurodeles waltl TaxID=8319 RepID=A0AAV7VKR7_PLEWA|nr:hypothetical protein NDU88_005019 [Pleurodeles waltl]